MIGTYKQLGQTGTTDEISTGAESPEYYCDSKYYPPGHNQSPKSYNHLMEKQQKANFDGENRCPG